MPQEEENYVALFIDWDNLAISTSVDFGGAVPDVRAIVHAAQRFGIVVLARAYAEWNVNSDRLSVYRAGVEPVYAPIFRFEPEPGAGMPRGKSLADPCMVTDSIDAMHLMPNVNVFVLVSGDKDLIPVVRLAQLRGKKVVVIGPDFVAAVLREMADEYIPYRGLVEAGEAIATPEIASPTRSGRRLHGGSSRSSQLPATTARQQAATPAPARESRNAAPAQAKAPATEPAPVEAVAAAPSVAPSAAPAPAAPVPAPVEAEAPAEENLEAGPLFETVRGILREREEGGKPRLRATNLKDQLLARIPGFNERRYGFPRFKDLLAAAEKLGVLNVSRTGPVQWVTLASAPAAPTPTPTPPALVAAPATEPATGAPPTESGASVAPEEPIDLDIIRFILDLRDRSRWLTYTYVLTNLLNHLGKGAADAAADSAARAALNHLVQSGVLIVDREPREIDVNGTRHRVRLCHVVADHPLVEQLSAEAAEAAPVLELAAPQAAPEEGAVAEPALSEAPAPEPTKTTAEATRAFESEAPVVIEAGAPTEEPLAASPAATIVGAESELTPSEASVAESAETRLAETGVEAAPATTMEPGAPSALSASVEEASTPAVARAPSIAEMPPAAETPFAEEPPPRNPVSAEAPTSRARTEAERAPAGSALENGLVANPPLTLTDSYDILRQVVREATGPSRPSTGPAAVKNRLVRRLGAFDERAFGFSKFKDYLLAAEKAGAVKVEVSGTTARVSLPPGA